MNILAIVLSILSLAILFCSIFKPKIGALLFLIYMYMAPYLYIGGFMIYTRTTALIFFVLFLFKFKRYLNRKDYKPFIPYILFLAFQFVLLFTSSVFLYSFNAWFTSCANLFFVMFLYGNIKICPKSIHLYSNALFVIFCMITVYGLILTLSPGVNPYQMILQPLFGQEFNEAYAAGNSGLSTNTELAEGRLFGRISSFFSHPMAYGLNLGFFFIFSLYFLRNKLKFLVLVLFVIIIAILTSGVRTPIAALAITCLLMLVYMRKFKAFIYGLLGIGGIIIIIPILYPELIDYIMSIFNLGNSNVSGSSLSMRLEQFEGCLDIVKYDMLTGKGYGWTDLYNSIHGAHPKALFFESLVYSVLVNTGIIGFIIWGIYIIGYYRYVEKTYSDIFSKTILLSLLFYYLIYSSITGDYFGVVYFQIYFVILVELINKANSNIVVRNLRSC